MPTRHLVLTVAATLTMGLSSIAYAQPLPSPRPEAPVAAPQSLAPNRTAPRQATDSGITARAATPVAQLDASQQQAVREVNAYFNGLSHIIGRFSQIGPDGTQQDGAFALLKPGRIRFQYERPNPMVIVADGQSIVIRDRRLATQDLYPLSQTPLRFLLQENLDLERDTNVVSVYSEPQLISIVIEENHPIAGRNRLILTFDKENDSAPFTLSQWTITDAQGQDTTVSVYDLDTRSSPNREMFTIDYQEDIVRNR